MRWLTRVAVWVLKHSDLTLSEYSAFITAILDESHVLPSRGIIEVGRAQRLLVDGKPIDTETLLKLRMSATQLKNNYARQFLRDHVNYQAVKEGLHKAIPTPEGIMLAGLFAKTAIWNGQQEEQYIDLLAGEATSAFNDE